MAHNFFKNANGSVNLYKMNTFRHHGPVCQTCGVQFCVDCNPEYMNSDCSWFR